MKFRDPQILQQDPKAQKDPAGDPDALRGEHSLFYIAGQTGHFFFVEQKPKTGFIILKNRQTHGVGAHVRNSTSGHDRKALPQRIVFHYFMPLLRKKQRQLQRLYKKATCKEPCNSSLGKL